MTLALASAPAVTPISVAEAKAHLRIDHAEDDALISSLIDAAVSYIDATGVLGRGMVTQDWAQWVSQAPGWVRLRLGPFQSLVSVEYYDTDGALQTATLADYETRLDGDFVICKPKTGNTWPAAQTRGDAIKITYRIGYGDAATDVPQNIRHALLMTVAHLYEQRLLYVDVQLREVPLAVEALIGVERVGWYG